MKKSFNRIVIKTKIQKENESTQEVILSKAPEECSAEQEESTSQVKSCSAEVK